MIKILKLSMLTIINVETRQIHQNLFSIQIILLYDIRPMSIQLLHQNVFLSVNKIEY